MYRPNEIAWVSREKKYDTIDQNDFAKKYRDAKKIVILGDSVAFGNGVKEEKTFAGLFRKNLTNHEIYNLALFGYQVEDYLVQLDEISKLYPIEKIVYFLTLNDVYERAKVKTVKYGENKYRKGFKRIFNHEFFRQVNVFFRDKSYLYTFLKFQDQHFCLFFLLYLQKL